MSKKEISLEDRQKPINTYYPQLDTLRIVAAVGIINLHWLAGNYLTLYGIHKSYDWGFGQYGVQLFFVLSGFLITDILIRSKGAEPKIKTILNFSIRRVLRLFPIYYLLILYLVCIKDQFVIENAGWFLTYTSNIRFYLSGGLVDVWSNHLWTLAIEEQFYLIFPAILLLVPRTREYLIPTLFILTAILFREAGKENEATFLLTFSQMDMLGMGILIALVKNRHPNLYVKLTSSGMEIPILLLLVVNAICYYFWLEHPIVKNGLPYLLLVCFGLLVLKTASGFTGFMRHFLLNPSLRYLGKISYGLYLYHKVIPLSLALLLRRMDIAVTDVFLYYVLNLGILLAVSHFSWKLVESPILQLKSRFRHSRNFRSH